MNVAADTMAYDARSKRQSTNFSYVDGTLGGEHNTFNNLGAATRDLAPAWNDTMTTDALGREQSRYSPVQGTTTTSSFYDSYGQATLLRVVTAHPGILKDTTDNGYNGGGALFNVTIRREVATQAPPGHLYPFFARQRIKDRYGADGKLMASETQFDTVDVGRSYGPQTYFEREEYRYDALGRRIWRRLVRPDIGICNKMDQISGCFSIVERTVWDGDQVLWEIRSDGGDGATTARMEADGGGPYVRGPLEGRVFYTHGGGLDHPLSIGRMDIAAGYIVPVYDWRGNALAGYCNGTTLCTQYQWLQEAASPWDQVPPPDGGASGPTTWKGNLVDTHTDGSGLVYKRNRYYDPSSGRFTQEDPLGLAGGLNAYGFAAADPINFSDPFGLEVCFPNPKTRSALKKATETATDTQLEIDDESGCVTKATDGKKQGFGDLRRRLHHAIEDQQVFNVFEGSASEANELGFVTVDLNGNTHYPISLLGVCYEGKSSSYNIESPGALIAHELLGHEVNGFTNNSLNDENGADAVENEYHAVANETPRLAYSCRTP